jgi:hypothetical protein
MKTVAMNSLTSQLLAEMRDPLFAEMLKLFVDGDGKPLSPFANLSPEQVAKAENIDVDTLNKNQRRGGDAAPPRYRTSPRRWGYVLFLYVAWKIRQIRKAEAGPVSPPRQRKPKNSEAATAIEALSAAGSSPSLTRS